MLPGNFRDKTYRGEARGPRKLPLVACTVLLLSACVVAQTWQQDVRAAVERKDFAGARALVEGRLSADGKDLEARMWRARLLAWTGRLQESEREYHALAQEDPANRDVIAGYADVLSWEGKLEDALAELDGAAEDREILLRRARLLRRLNRSAEASEVFRELLRLEPGNAEAKAALVREPGDPRHELRFGADADHFNYTEASSAQSVSLVSRWDTRWTTSVSTTFYQRFGAGAQRVTGSVARRFGSSWIAIGGGGAHDEGVIAKREANLEIGRAFRLVPTSAKTGQMLGTLGQFIRGVEIAYDQHWLWFEGSKVMVIAGSGLFYLPRDWRFTVRAGAARSSFRGRGAEWQPSGASILDFPIQRRIRGNLSFAVGAENYAKADEVGHFSARTFGAGVRYRIGRAHEIGCAVYFQDRSQRRTQTSVVTSYAIRF